ncbi:MAG: complex I NDUFA9 subunit family protein [Alphaproteobacteria bacterium]|nr:complex I NDUFA9 subunit family protein [Alphaproteobacteria bacterium]
MAGRMVTVFGGNGFVGRHIVQRLARSGDRVTIACRDPEAAIFLKPLGDPGQITIMKANITRPDEVARAVTGADAVVNCVGLLAPSGANTFERAHVDGAGLVAKAAKDAGATAFVQISALGADETSKSQYARTKAKGEQAVLNAFPDATILRPSLIIGPEDGFMNMFAKIARWSPVLPVMGCSLLPRFATVAVEGTKWRAPTFRFCDDGGPRFHPVFVGDVADAAVRALGDGEARGKTYELVGPRTYSFRHLMELMLAATGRKRMLVPYPLFLANIAAFFLEWVPGKPLTRDQVCLLRGDNVASGTLPGLADLGITAQGIESVLPTYMWAYKPPAGRRVRPREM